MKEKNKTITEFVIKLVKGIIIGLGTITAGAGTFAIILGVYNRCMEIIAKPFKRFKQNIIYILPIILGIVISFFLFKNGVIYLFNNYNSYMKCLFFGIILGGIPTLIKQANKKEKKSKHLIAFFIAFILTIIATYFGNRFGIQNRVESKMEMIHIFIYGIIYGFGAIMPGMTTLHVLIFLGVWGQIIKGIVAFDLFIIIPFVAGYLLIILLTANLISYCFEKFYGYTYFAIIGFSITSLIMLVPKPITMLEYVLCPIILLLSLFGMYYISKLENKMIKGRIN